MTTPFVPVFDGHNDLLLHLFRAGDDAGDAFIAGRDGHLDLAKCRAGGFAGGLFAIYVPDPANTDGSLACNPVETGHARAVTLRMAAILLRLTRARPDAIRLCTSVAQIAAAREAGAIAAVMHIEGAEGIGPDLAELEVLHAAGLRSLGPVWSRPNIFGHGVPFVYPSGPDIGPGLTDAGKRLIRECERLGILIDLSHMNEAGFWDIARMTSQPLVATHSNVHLLSAQSRNLTEAQLSAIAESEGLVGLNYACCFLREDGADNADTPLSVMVRHLAHLVERLGERGVALGSDFDGAMVPAGIEDAGGLQALVAAMREAGFGEPLIEAICWRNWQDMLARVIG